MYLWHFTKESWYSITQLVIFYTTWALRAAFLLKTWKGLSSLKLGPYNAEIWCWQQESASDFQFYWLSSCEKFIFEVMLMTVNFRESELAWGAQPAGDSLTPIYHHRRSQFMSVVTSVKELKRDSLKYRQNKNFVSSFIFYAFDSRHKLYENVDGEPTCMYYNSWPSPTLSMTLLHLCRCPQHARFLLHSVRMQVSSKV